MRFVLTAGQAHDKHAVAELLRAVTPGSDVVTDRAYDNPGVLAEINAARALAHIPTTSRKLIQRSVDPALIANATSSNGASTV